MGQYVRGINRWEGLFGNPQPVPPASYYNQPPVGLPMVDQGPIGQPIFDNNANNFNGNQPQVAAAGFGSQGLLSDDPSNAQYSESAVGIFKYKQDEGPNSDYIKCVYEGARTGRVVELLCEKNADCCGDGCCPKDLQSMGGLYVLIAFVVVVFVVGLIIAIVCYARSSSKQRKEKDRLMYEGGYAGSQVGYPYGSSIGPPSNRY